MWSKSPQGRAFYIVHNKDTNIGSLSHTYLNHSICMCILCTHRRLTWRTRRSTWPWPPGGRPRPRRTSAGPSRSTATRSRRWDRAWRCPLPGHRLHLPTWAASRASTARTWWSVIGCRSSTACPTPSRGPRSWTSSPSWPTRRRWHAGTMRVCRAIGCPRRTLRYWATLSAGRSW